MSKTSRRTFLHQSGLGAGAMWLASRDGAAVGGTGERRRLNPWRVEPVDLRRFMRLGVEHVYRGAIDRRRGCLPYVRFNLTDPPIWGRHEYWGSPHMVGRFLDALALCADIIDVPPDDEAVNGLRKLLHDCLANPSGLPFDTLPNPQGKKTATMHHCREVLLGLLGLARWRQCDRSATLARGLVRTLERVTRETGSFPAPVLGEDGWAKPEPVKLNQTTGRLIGALVAYYQATKDNVAVEVAKRFADDNIAKTFTPAGELTKVAGTHLHSTEGTMAAILYLGALTGEKRYLEIGRRLYDVGLRRWRTSYGWAKESRSDAHGRGEANNTGDFIEAALVLATSGHPAYFADAERFIRNGLLAAQVVNTDWIPQSDKADTADYAHTDIRNRARGAFAFTTPNGYHSYNTDLMGGALRALCKAHQATVTGDADADADRCRVNMRFSVDSPWLMVRSSLPAKGRLEIQTRKRCNLFARLPEQVSQQGVHVRVGGRPRPVKVEGSELAIGDVPPDAAVIVSFDTSRRQTQEPAPGYSKPFEIDWVADTIIAMRPSEGRIALY